MGWRLAMDEVEDEEARRRQELGELAQELFGEEDGDWGWLALGASVDVEDY
jgi:hypothetical protein